MKRTLIAAAALLVVGAAAALAANTTGTPYTKPDQVAEATLPQHCTALEQQFAKEEASHKSAAAYQEAVKLRDEGMKLCKEDKHKEGIKTLEEGLLKLGVTPVKR